ncbi:glycosyltransferase family 9 protein [Desulfocurvus sp. DL9XJH121]
MTPAPTFLPLEGVRKILVCQLRQIGDVLLCTPALRLLKERYPEAEVHLMTEAKAAPMVQGNPDVARIWSVDKRAHKNLGAQLAFYLRVAHEGFDLVVDFQQLPRIRWVVGLSRFFPPASGRQVRLSYEAPWYNRWLYTHTVRPRDGYAAMAKASVLEPLGIRWNGEPPRLYLTEDERAQAAATLAAHGVGPGDVLVTVDPSHRRDTRRWPARHFGELIRLAAEADPRLKFLVLWGPGEEDVAREVAKAANVPACATCKELLSLRHMAACIERAALHLGNCSAPKHMALAVGVNTLSIQGSTSNAWTYPGPGHKAVSLGLPCQPCNENICPRGRCACLEDLEPKDVLPELLELLPTGAEG